jgi:hypothetical protein
MIDRGASKNSFSRLQGSVALRTTVYVKLIKIRIQGGKKTEALK